jgi:S-DNA-T family DNA segregation ATPase FtsK/SpoIIIE
LIFEVARQNPYSPRMARKEPSESTSSKGFDDVIGIVLVFSALFLLVALFSYDPLDVGANTATPNTNKHNWAGPLGAWVGYGLFFVFGAGAFVMPVLMLYFGLGYLFKFLAFIRQRWVWATVLFISCMGLLDLYTKKIGLLENISKTLNAPSAGGLVGSISNNYLFGYAGVPGATILYGMLYMVSLVFLTNFQLGDWLRAAVPRKSSSDADATEEEKELERKAKDLEKQARKLQDQVEKTGKTKKPAAVEPEDEKEKSGLGADLQPVPEPMIRDLSVPSPSRTPRSKKTSVEPESEPVIQPPDDIIVISAKEIAAATTSDILGKAAKKSDVPLAEEPKQEKEKEDEPLAAAAATVTNDEGPLPPPSAPISPMPKPRFLPKKPKQIAVASTPQIGNYRLPALDFLQLPDTNVKPTESKEELMANAQLMRNTLAQFDIEVAVGDITKGPTITRYELHPAPGVRLEKITALSNNIAAALKAERINILAPVPGKSSVGVEVPNAVKTKVIMRDLLESDEWQKSKARIPLALGKDVYGQPIIADLAEMPHLLIAGSTGSGKSVCINSIIASLLYRFPPDQLRFVMIDPKVVELQQYNALPHLVVPVVTDPKKVILALRWVVNEMEKRYQIFAKVGVRNIKSFNERPRNKPVPKSEPELLLTAKKEKIEAGQDGFAVELDEEIVVPRDEDIVIPEKLSYIVVIIDELADLMLVAPADVEMAIARITQMARAAGIHCIVATQRPSVDVITGVIKANIPARIAFQVAAKVDSRTILDAMGADKLLGKGDMLYLPPGSARLIRAQGVLITDQEIQQCVDFIAQQGKPSYELEIHRQLQKPVANLENEGGCGEDEAIIEQCIEVIRSEQKASVSLLQRRLRLGYGRAARIMDELENRGIVGPSKGAEPRDILIDLDGQGADGQPAVAGA